MKYTEDEYLVLLKAYKDYLSGKDSAPTSDESKLLVKLTFYEEIKGRFLYLLQISIRKHIYLSQFGEPLKSFVLSILHRK